MANVVYSYLTFVVKDFIFFSGDVQTTAIAMAIVSSLCLSIVWAVCHVLVGGQMSKGRNGRKRSKFSSLQGQIKGSSHSRHSRSSSSSEDDVNCSEDSIPSNVDVPCVKCRENYADFTCRFVTCRLCCFCPVNCFAHSDISKPPCRPCPPKSFGITEMDLRGKIERCPKRLGFMGPQLTLLNLAQNNLSELPAEIGCLRGLQELHLHKNKLSSIPDSIGTLVNLRMLTLSHNQLPVLPDSLTYLSSIKYLDVGHNKLTSLPHNMDRMHKLRTLILGHNNFTRIPECVFELQRLKKLTLNNNNLDLVQEEIEKLYHLEILDLTHCCLDYLPENLCHCSQLKQLNISSNRLTELPVKLGTLGYLYKLLVAKNQLQYLPSTLSLDKLNKYNFSGNPFVQSVPSSSHSTVVAKFPPLVEITSRFIASQKSLLDKLHHLPTCLQGQFRNPKRCTTCHQPVFQYYTESVEFRTFQEGTFPFLSRNCSPHLKQHSNHTPAYN